MNSKPGEHIVPDCPENESFIRGLVERAEADWPDKEGKLRPGVTHEIVGTGPKGLPIVREVRKSAF